LVGVTLIGVGKELAHKVCAAVIVAVGIGFIVTVACVCPVHPEVVPVTV
jgi:hypothetical protein